MLPAIKQSVLIIIKITNCLFLVILGQSNAQARAVLHPDGRMLDYYEYFDSPASAKAACLNFANLFPGAGDAYGACAHQWIDTGFTETLGTNNGIYLETYVAGAYSCQQGVAGISSYCDLHRHEFNYFTAGHYFIKPCPEGLVQNRDTGLCGTPPKNQGPDYCGSTPNPITLATGNKWVVESDYRGPYRLSFERFYNSLDTDKSTQIGHNWHHTYDRSLSVFSANLSAAINREDGRRYTFNSTGTDWISDADVVGTLTQTKNTSGVITRWDYRLDDGTVETYNRDGRLLAIKDLNGVIRSLTYSSSTTPATIAPEPGLLIKVTDSFGRGLNFTYDANSRLKSLTDPSGAVTTYDYDADNNLSTVTYPDDTPADLTDNPKKIYVYGELANTANISQPYALTGIIDENNVRYATYKYNASGKAVSSEHAGGVDKYQLAYSANSTSVTDPLNSVYTTNFHTLLGVVKSTGQNQPGGSGCAASASSLSYDANGNVAYRIDFNGNRTNYAYDLVRNLETSRTEGLTATGATTPQNRTITTEWHPTFRLPVKITEPGLETAYSYDTHGNITHKSLKDLATYNTREWHTTYTYSTAGLLLSKVEDGPRTDVSDITSYDYYPADAVCTGGHLGCRGQLKKITTALDHLTRITRYSAQGQPEEIIDPNGLITTLAYDTRRRLTASDIGGELTTYNYNPVGQMDRVTQPGGAYLVYRYDDAHRLIEIKDNLNNTLAYTLDDKGNQTKEELFDPSGQLARSQSRIYDALSRLQNLVQPE